MKVIPTYIEVQALSCHRSLCQDKVIQILSPGNSLPWDKNLSQDKNIYPEIKIYLGIKLHPGIKVYSR